MKTYNSDISLLARGPVRVVSAWTLALSMALVASSTLHANPIDFTLTSTLSTLDLTATGSLFGGALTVAEQSGTAKATRYFSPSAGSIKTGLGLTKIEFPGGSVARSDVQRNLLNIPVGLRPGIGGNLAATDPGAYGLRMTAPFDIDIPPLPIPNLGTIDLGRFTGVQLDVALRNLDLDFTSGQIPLAGTAFDASNVDVEMVSGVADIGLSLVLTANDLISKTVTLLALQTLVGALPATIPLSVTTPSIFSLNINIGGGFSVPFTSLGALPNSATGGMLEHIGPNYKLTVPVEFNPLVNLDASLLSLLGLDLDLKLTGQMVATAPFQNVPEPSSWALGLVGTVALAWARRRVR